MVARKRYEISLPTRRLTLGDRTLVMGVLNVTPDSFYDGGRYFRFRDAISRGLELEDQGAEILDIGGQSSRPPFSKTVPDEEEIRRVVPVIESLRKRVTVPISVDTFSAKVAKAALSSGAEIVNDIGALRLDKALPEVVASARAALVLMHSRGMPKNMHQMPPVKDILGVVLNSLRHAIRRAMIAGIRRTNLIVDPGFGFSKLMRENLVILKNIESLRRLDFPILVGVSRKSFIGRVLGVPVDERMLGSLACCALAVAGGAHIVRTHDVAETLQVVRMCDAVASSNKRPT